MEEKYKITGKYKDDTRMLCAIANELAELNVNMKLLVTHGVRVFGRIEKNKTD
jgi:hypothetical protein